MKAKLYLLATAMVMVMPIVIAPVAVKPGGPLPGYRVIWPGARAAACSKADFVSAVESASTALGALNRKNKPKFQARLRRLRQKNAWSHAVFIKKAAPFVRDDEISEFDVRSQEALMQIELLGSEGEAAALPDCSTLEVLRGHMSVLVKTQNDKWRYMFAKIDRALAN